MSSIYEEDILNAGKNQVIISNDNTKVVIVPELGGRIADVQSGETKFLHRTYPDGVEFGPYTEYGGIEECIGGAPGTLWNADWKWEQQNGGVLLQARSKSVLINKLISLDETKPIIKIDYSFYSFSDTFSKFTFGIHPEVSIGGELEKNQYHVPTGGELLNGSYPEPGFKSKLPPSEGWCAITHDGKVMGQMFPEGVIDVVQLYYPKVGTHMILGPIIFGVGISPGMCAGFAYMIYMGDGDVDTVKQIRAAREAELTTKYEPFDTAEIPEELMAELEDRAGQPAEPGPAPVIPEPPRIPGMPQIPKVEVPDVGAIIQNALKGIKVMKGMKIPGVDVDISPASEPESDGLMPDDMRTEDLPPETKIVIEHLKGNVDVHIWDHGYVDYSEVKGTVEVGSGGGFTNVKIEASGDYSLRVPRNVSSISLNFVNGNASVTGVGSPLKISGVNGNASIVAKAIPAGAELDVSLVKGNIDMGIPGDSSCSISAKSMSGGDISCDLPLQEEERTRNQLSGVLNDRTARILLNTVRGDISIGQVKAEEINGDGETAEEADSPEVTVNE